ncbi:MAG: SGNH/GDSL hydrolase family protein, partial [Planctomycetota bacterium]
MRQRFRAFVKKFLLLAFSILVCFTIVEVFLRATMKFKPATGSYVVDFEVGKRLVPGFEGNHYGADVKISSLGIRDREFPREVPEGRTRIICLGDSWTFGTGVTDEETWPGQLQARLNEQGFDVETVNTGVSGYETHQESIVYRRDHAQNLEHDLVVVGVYPVNDVHDKHLRHSRHKRLYDFHPLAYKIYTYPKRNLYTLQLYKSWKKERKHRARMKKYAAANKAHDKDPNGFAAGE